MVIFSLIEVTSPWKPAQWKHVLTFKSTSCGNIKLYDIVIYMIFWNMCQYPAVVLHPTSACLIGAQQVTVSRIDHRGICVFTYRDSFWNVLWRLCVFHDKLSFDSQALIIGIPYNKFHSMTSRHFLFCNVTVWKEVSISCTNALPAYCTSLSSTAPRYCPWQDLELCHAHSASLPSRALLGRSFRCRPAQRLFKKQHRAPQCPPHAAHGDNSRLTPCRRHVAPSRLCWWEGPVPWPQLGSARLQQRSRESRWQLRITSSGRIERLLRSQVPPR